MAKLLSSLKNTPARMTKLLLIVRLQAIRSVMHATIRFFTPEGFPYVFLAIAICSEHRLRIDVGLVFEDVRPIERHWALTASNR